MHGQKYIKFSIPGFTEFLRLEPALIHAHRRKDGQTEMANIISDFSDCANAPKRSNHPFEYFPLDLQTIYGIISLLPG